jgi:Tol biopolymer transport system component
VRRATAITLALLLVAIGVPSTTAGQVVPRSAGSQALGAPLPAPPGTTTLVSRARDDSFPNADSREPVISADGRIVAFISSASDLVKGDDPGTVDVFAWNRATGKITRAPLPRDPSRTSPASLSDPSISDDGRIVAFSFLVPSVSLVARLPPRPQIIIWDRQTGGLTVAAANSDGVALSGTQPSVSGNGRYVAFTTTDELPGDADDGRDDVVRFDRQTGNTVLVSTGFLRGGIRGNANAPSINRSGRYVAFASDGGKTVIDADTGPGMQVYLRDMNTGRTEQVSVGMGGSAARSDSLEPSISGDGRYVAFSSRATNLSPEGAAGVFRRDRQTGTTVLVSVRPDGASGNGVSNEPAISASGSMVAFVSRATDLVPETQGGIAPAALVVRIPAEVFLRDIDTGETVLISVNLTGGATPRVRSAQPSVDRTGRFTAFASDADTLVGGDDNKAADVFLRDLPPAPTIAPATLQLGSQAVGTESLPLAATLTNGGWSPLGVTGSSLVGAGKNDFRIVLDGCAGRTLRRGQSCTVSVIFRPTANGTRTATLRVADDYAGSPRTVRLRGSASLAELVLDPPLGQPGIVTIAEGSGFPPGVPVQLSWTVGITPRLDPVIPDETGSFRVQVLVFHNDRTGERELLAQPLDGSSFPPVSAPMLVTRPSVVPPRFEQLRFIDVPLVLVIRG